MHRRSGANSEHAAKLRDLARSLGFPSDYVELSNSGQTVVVWFVSPLDGRGPRRALKMTIAISETEVATMPNLPFALKSPAVLRPIF